MKYYLDLYLTYLKIFAKTMVEYRMNFGIVMVTFFIVDGMNLLFINVIFSRIRQLEGWSFYEVILLYGLITAARSFTGSFLNMPWEMQGYIQSGRLDILLVRPPDPLFQMIGGYCLEPTALGRLVVGVAAIMIALRGLALPFQLWWVVYIPLVIVSGAVLLFSLLLMVACTGFWFTSVFAAIFPVSWFTEFVQFPVVIYPLPIQFLLTWVLPYAMISFYPAAFLTRGGAYQLYGLLSPLIGFLFLGLALLVWRFSFRIYQSTGS